MCPPKSFSSSCFSNRFEAVFSGLGCLALCLMIGCGLGTKPAPVISEAELEAEVNSSEVVLVKFGAQWCGPCKMVDQELDKLVDSGLTAKVVPVDIDANQQLAQKYGVGGIPHLILFKRGQMVDQSVGYMPAEEIEAWINSGSSDQAADDSSGS